MSTKSPFYVVREFISPLACEELIDNCNFTIPDKDKALKDVKTVRTSDASEKIVYEKLMQLFPDIEQYYGVKYRGTERINFEWFPTGSRGDFISENSVKLREKWVRTKNRDFTGILFLSDFQNTPQFEQDYEVYGGRLEFVQHQFSFKPLRGTLVLFPSDPYFINITTDIFAGEAYQARIQVAVEGGYRYNMKDFPGNYTTWF